MARSVQMIENLVPFPYIILSDSLDMLETCDITVAGHTSNGSGGDILAGKSSPRVQEVRTSRADHGGISGSTAMFLKLELGLTRCSNQTRGAFESDRSARMSS